MLVSPRLVMMRGLGVLVSSRLCIEFDESVKICVVGGIVVVSVCVIVMLDG